MAVVPRRKANHPGPPAAASRRSGKAPGSRGRRVATPAPACADPSGDHPRFKKRPRSSPTRPPLRRADRNDRPHRRPRPTAPELPAGPPGDIVNPSSLDPPRPQERLPLAGRPEPSAHARRIVSIYPLRARLPQQLLHHDPRTGRRRLVARHVGGSLVVWTSVIGVILAGICLGNVLGGRLADRIAPDPRCRPAVGPGALLSRSPSSS